jgi:hypothetical protein
VDKAFDAALERYSPRDLVLLVYHMHAPDTDPMVSSAAVARHKFYGMRGTPSVVLDGKQREFGDDNSSETAVFNGLDEAIASRLEVPAQARIALNAAMDGSIVRVKATVDQVKSQSPDLRLHVMLVEKEISYSGANGLRFHPMVVRAMASQSGIDGGGFSIDSTKPLVAEQSFDLGQVSQELQKYMKEYLEDISKRIGSAHAKEDKSKVNPSRLAVVAFVQDADSHEVLQVSMWKSNRPAVL